MGSFHCALAHKSVSIREALKIPEGKAAVDKEWENSIKIPACDIKKARSKSEVVRQAKKDGKTVHCANLMNLCHLKNAELPKHLQKFKGRVVLWRGNVKDEEVYRAVFTERGGSGSQIEIQDSTTSKTKQLG